MSPQPCCVASLGTYNNDHSIDTYGLLPIKLRHQRYLNSLSLTKIKLMSRKKLKNLIFLKKWPIFPYIKWEIKTKNRFAIFNMFTIQPTYANGIAFVKACIWKILALRKLLPTNEIWQNQMKLLVKVEQGLCFNHRNLVRVCGECMDMQLGFACLEIDIAEGLQAIDFKLGKPDENAAVPAEAFEVGETLPIEVCAKPFNLEVGHIADPPAKRAFMRARPLELEALNQATFRHRLPWGANHLGHGNIAGKNAYDVGTAGDPNQGLVFLCFELSAGVNIEEFRVQRSLKQTER